MPMPPIERLESRPHLEAVDELVRVVAREDDGAFRGDVLRAHHFDAPKENGEDRVQEDAHGVEEDGGRVVGNGVEGKDQRRGRHHQRGDAQDFNGHEHGVEHLKESTWRE